MVEGWFFLSAALLLVSGGAKLRDPTPTAGALRAATLPSARPLVFLLAAGETIVGAGSLLLGGRIFGWLLAGLYMGFAVFVAVALRRRLPIASCGCFGKTDTPPSLLHLVLNLTAVGGGIRAAITPSRPLVAALAGQPLLGIPYLAFLAVGTFLAYLVLSDLPRLVRPVTGPVAR